jgi:hypothetical protein
LSPTRPRWQLGTAAKRPVLDWRERLVCSRRGSQQTDMVVTGKRRRDRRRSRLLNAQQPDPISDGSGLNAIADDKRNQLIRQFERDFAFPAK